MIKIEKKKNLKNIQNIFEFKNIVKLYSAEFRIIYLKFMNHGI